MPNLLRRLGYLLRRRQTDDLADELEFHRRMKAEELRARGVSEADLAAATQRALGNDLLARERARDVWIAPWLQDITQDLKFGARMLVKERRFALTAIVTLGLGIAVTSTVFTFVNVIFRDLPFTEPDRLLTVRTLDPRGFQTGISYREYREWEPLLTAFSSFSAETSQSVNVSDDAHTAERLSGTFVTFNKFSTLGVSPIVGRDFVADDDREGATAVVMLSHGLWVTRYGGEHAIVGRSIRVNEAPATVIGVMPERFSYPAVADLWMPMTQRPNLQHTTWASTAFGIAGRLKDGVSEAQARSEIETLAARTTRDHKEIKQDRRLEVKSLKQGTVAPGAMSLMWALLGAAAVVLFVAAANVANLQLARAWHRSRETAVRLAMGATRWRVIRQVLVECALIGAGGSALGVYLSIYGFQAMTSAFNVQEFGAFDRPRKVYWFDPSLDGAGWLALGAIFLLASIGAGLIPALQLSRTGVNDVLKDGRGGAATHASRRWASALMIGQIAVALVLLACGGLFARSFFALYQTDPIIDPRDIVSMRLTLSSPKYATADQRLQFIRRLDERLMATPALGEAAIGNDVPIQPLTADVRSVTIEGRDVDPMDTPPRVTYMLAGPRYFETVRFPIARGRALTDQDSRAGAEGVVVNQRFVALFLREHVDPLGARIRLTPLGAPVFEAPWLTIVGVVPTMPDFLPNQPDDPVAYAPLLAERGAIRTLAVMVRSPSKAATAAALRAEVSRLDPDLPVYGILTMEEALAITRSGARMVGSWFQTLAAITVILACVGLYALTAHRVAQRTQEIGLRMALGARSSQVVWLFVRQTLALLGAGLAIGIIGALMSSRLLTAFLGDVDPRDPLTFVTVAIVLAAVAVAAGVGPARRAARIDPAVALRAD